MILFERVNLRKSSFVILNLFQNLNIFTTDKENLELPKCRDRFTGTPDMNLTQQRFSGFQNTPFLWENDLHGIEQFRFDSHSLTIQKRIDDTIRLGNYVERLVSFELSNNPSIEILKENAQIISNRLTLGEIDCILLQNDHPIHLEIAYKFYLYDPSVGNTFLEHWIGPNRRDSLVLKLNKIREKQFPLLYSKECRELLKELNINIEKIEQQSYVKAQLFVSYQSHIDFPELNQECVVGYYINSLELKLFKDCKFYIPKKLDWLIQPHPQVDWINLEQTTTRIQEFHQRKSAPLCWIKYPNGEISKLFVVWW